MNPLRELRGLVTNTSSIETGAVTSVTATSISVRSRGGLKSFSISTPGQFKPGDTVRFQGNVLLGKATSIDNIPVFKV